MSDSLPPPGSLDATEIALVELGGETRRLKRALDDATATPIFIDYHLAPDWFEGVEAAIDAVEDHLATDPTAALILTEHAIGRLEAAGLDDSDGWLGQAIPRLERIHAAACKRLTLDPEALAERLSVLAKSSELDAFYDAADTHADALGDQGLRALLRGGGGADA